ncbi:Small RNA degrading nuclease 5, partial [Dictyocoela roeselum]
MKNVDYNFKFCKNMDISDIRKMIAHIFLASKRPKFIKIKDKAKFESLNLIFGVKNHSFGKVALNISLRQLHDLILKKPIKGLDEIKSDISVFTEENIRPFIIKNPMKLYRPGNEYIDSDANLSSVSMNGFREFNKITPNWMVAIDCEMVETTKFGDTLDEELKKYCSLSADVCRENKSLDENKNASAEKTPICSEIRSRFYFETLETREGSSKLHSRPKRQSELGRITIINHKNVVLYDKIVKPVNTISDYRTPYSGLTKKGFRNAISFETMQNEIMKIIGRNTVIVGHSLENELKAMKVYHELLIDTAHLFRSPDNEKVKLRNLVYKFLKMSIQAFKHCS